MPTQEGSTQRSRQGEEATEEPHGLLPLPCPGQGPGAISEGELVLGEDGEAGPDGVHGSRGVPH
jgi:hypothetical protein